MWIVGRRIKDGLRRPGHYRPRYRPVTDPPVPPGSVLGLRGPRQRALQTCYAGVAVPASPSQATAMASLRRRPAAAASAAAGQPRKRPATARQLDSQKIEKGFYAFLGAGAIDACFVDLFCIESGA